MTPHAIPVKPIQSSDNFRHSPKLPTHTPYDRVITIIAGAGRRAGALDVRSEY